MLLLLKFELSSKLLLFVMRTIVAEVNSSALWEKQIFKSLLPLILGNEFDLLNLAFFSVKHVLVVSNLLTPVPVVFFA